MKTVITYGTFDLLHYGHINLLKRAKQLGDKLIVGVSTDEFCKEKGKQTIYNLEKRMEMVSDLKFVDLVISEKNMQQKISDIKKFKVDIFVLGDDYKYTFTKMAEYEEVSKLCEVVFLERTKGVSSTLLKEQFKQ